MIRPFGVKEVVLGGQNAARAKPLPRSCRIQPEAQTIAGATRLWGDADGVIFLPDDRLTAIVPAAEGIRATEREQARRMRGGTTFREQARFDEYIARRTANPALGFREHLRAVGKAIEE